MKLALTLTAALVAGAGLSPTFLATCGGPPPEDFEDCADGLDNDGDGAVDCNDSECMGGTNLIVTEIQMHPSKIADVDGEYVEFTNFDDRCVDLSKATIAEDSGLPPSPLPSNSLVKPGATFVVAGAFYPADNCGVTANAAWAYDSTLNDGHDTVTLKAADGTQLVRLEYCVGAEVGGCQGDWPSCPDGAALEYCGPDDATSNAQGELWQCATQAYGCGDLGSPKAFNACF